MNTEVKRTPDTVTAFSMENAAIKSEPQLNDSGVKFPFMPQPDPRVMRRRIFIGV